jgi:hypothetical protein
MQVKHDIIPNFFLGVDLDNVQAVKCELKDVINENKEVDSVNILVFVTVIFKDHKLTYHYFKIPKESLQEVMISIVMEYDGQMTSIAAMIKLNVPAIEIFKAIIKNQINHGFKHISAML